jgi:membrane-bound lytic murein transglycosylase D
MKDTGRVYLRVGPFRDERTNPEAATRAAARLLKDNYDYLQSWPLAVMAYNHGREGVARAVKAQGTRDLKTLLTEHRGPSYGFASRNFYFEFRAAIRAERIFDTATATYGRSPAKQ